MVLREAANLIDSTVLRTAQQYLCTTRAGSQKSEVRGRKSEVESRKSEVGSQKSEVPLNPSTGTARVPPAMSAQREQVHFGLLNQASLRATQSNYWDHQASRPQ